MKLRQANSWSRYQLFENPPFRTEHYRLSTAGQIVSLGKALSDQLIRRCCIDRLSWQLYRKLTAYQITACLDASDSGAYTIN